MTLSKRLFDLVLAGILCLPLLPLGVLVAICMKLIDGGPVLYLSERMRGPSKPFTLIKFRTMQDAIQNTGVTGGDKTARVTRTGHWLRRWRLDEVPQLINILRGDMSFVGPRPPLRRYVEQFPDLYAHVLKSRPGVTGLATLAYHRTEERILSACTTSEQTEAAYIGRCVPRKAALDRIYTRRQSLCFDARLVLATVFRGFVPKGRGGN